MIDHPAFTALDRVILEAAIATARGDHGALDGTALIALAREVVALSAHRPHACVHRGFADAIAGEPHAHEPGDDERAEWRLAGFLCGARQCGRDDAIGAAIAADASTATRLGAGTSPASGLAAPALFEAVLRASGLPAAAARLAPPAVVAAGPKLAARILGEAVARMRGGAIEEAAPALDLLDAAMRAGGDRVATPETRREHRRRTGQLHRLRGDFDRAAAVFDEILAADPTDDLRRRALADLGLCRAKVRALSDVRLPAQRARRESLAAALAAGESCFRDAGTAAGDLCVGVLQLARGRTADARQMLDRAIASMSAEPDVHHNGGLLGRARLWRLASGNIAHAAADLEAALDAVPSEVTRLLGDILLELAVDDPDRAASLATLAHETLGDAAVDVAREVGLLDKLPPLRSALLARAAPEGRPAAQRFDDARQVLVAARDANDLEQAREAFDLLEDLGSRTAAERAKFLTLASDLDAWEQVWEPHEARFAMVPMLVQEGRSDDAANHLIAAARDLAARGDEGSAEMAREALEQAYLWGAQIPPELKRALGPPPPLPPPGRKPHGRVLLIGGNETQKQYAAFLQDHVKTSWPGVTLDIEFPGWSSNWGRELPRFETKIQTAGAVVLLKFVRTLFGHRMRAFCSRYGRPWVACTGHGRDSIQRAIDRAILLL